MGQRYYLIRLPPQELVGTFPKGEGRRTRERRNELTDKLQFLINYLYYTG